MKAWVFTIAAVAALMPASSFAHHSLGSYNRSIYLVAEGTVKSFEWSNPHVQLEVMIVDHNGVAKLWRFEGGSISQLALNGFTKGIVAPGDKIKVQYNPKRTGANGGLFLGITTPDGRNHNVERLALFKPGD